MRSNCSEVRPGPTLPQEEASQRAGTTLKAPSPPDLDLALADTVAQVKNPTETETEKHFRR